MLEKNWDANSYSANSELQYVASLKFYETLRLNGNETILDIGCGTGALTSQIANRIPKGKIIGIDSSSEMITYASTYNAANNIEYHLMSGDNLCFTHTFDVIISSFCVHWIKNKNKLFKDIAKHITPQGQILIIMPFKHQGLAQIRHTLMSEPKWSAYFDKSHREEALLSDNEYDVYARNAELTNVTFTTDIVTTVFDNSFTLKAFLANVTPAIDKLPTQTLQNEFMDDIIMNYLEFDLSKRHKPCSITYTYGKLSSI